MRGRDTAPAWHPVLSMFSSSLEPHRVEPGRSLPKSTPAHGPLDLVRGAHANTRTSFPSRLLSWVRYQGATFCQELPFLHRPRCLPSSYYSSCQDMSFPLRCRALTEEKGKTLQVEVSMRVGSLVCAREQINFFLLRKQSHSDSLVWSREAGELASGGRSPGQQTVGWRVPPCPPWGRQPHQAGH